MDDDGPSGFSDYSLADVVLGVLGLMIPVALLLGGLPLVMNWLRQKGSFLPETALPVLLIVGTVLLLLAVGTLTIVFGKMKLTSFRNALGLPEGSIRAIIALLLILLFFITAVFLYSNVSRRNPSRELDGVTQTQLDAFPPDQIASQVVTSGDGADALYSVVLYESANQDGVDMAKYVLTTVGTLVVSISAFYFGARSVDSAVAARTAIGPSTGAPEGYEPTPPDAGPTDVERAAEAWTDTGAPEDTTAAALDAETIAGLGLVEVEGIEVAGVAPDHNADHGVNDDDEMDDERGDD